MQLVEVIDTAVKIGLGALISGGTVYVTQKQNHKAHAQAEAKKTEKDLLLAILSNFDTYTRTLNDFHAVLDGTRISAQKYELDVEEWDDLWCYVSDHAEKLFEIGDTYTAASSRLRLLGLHQALEKLEAIGRQEDELRQFYNQISNQKVYPKERYLLEWHEQFRLNKIAFNEAMAKHYRSLVRT